MSEAREAARSKRVGLGQAVVSDPRTNRPGSVSASAHSLLTRAKAATALQILAKLAFAALVVTLPFRSRAVLLARPLPPVYGDYTDLLLFPSDLCMVSTLLLWLLSLGLRPRPINRGPAFLFKPLVAMIGVGGLSVVFSVDRVLSLYNAVHLVLLAGLALYVLNEIKSLKAIVLPVAVQIFVQAAVGVTQALQQHSISLQSLGELQLDPTWRGVSIVSAGGIRTLRAYGLTDHPNILGGCLAFALALLAAWYMQSNPKWRAPAGGVFALGALALLLTFSRSAWVALGGAAIWMVLALLKTRQTGALVSWLGLAGAAFIVVAPFAWRNADNLGVRLNQNDSFSTVAAEDQALGDRSLLNDVALKLLADRPLTGVGLGAFTIAFREGVPDYPFDYQPPHIAALDAAAEIGVVGALAYVVALIGPWLALVVNRRRLTFSPALIGVSGVLLAVTLVGLFDYYTWLLAPGRLWQWIVWGLWAAIYQSALKPVATT